MRRVAFDYHRTTGRERRGGVATGHGERQRKITGAEHDDRPQRYFALSQVRTRRRLAIRHSRIHAQAEPAALAQLIREQAQLPDRSAALTRESRNGQARLGVSALEEL